MDCVGSTMIMSTVLWVSYVLTLFIVTYWLILYFEEDKHHHNPTPKKVPRSWPGITVLVPAYNEEDSIEGTVRSILRLDYPQSKLHIIVVNDGSRDGTHAIAKKLANAHNNLVYIKQKNQGKAAALNNALLQVTTPFFACLDADSFVHPQAAKEMVSSFLADKELEICTPVLRVNEPKTLLQKFQRVEYLAAMLLVRLFSSLEGNYVAPGPFSMYRTHTIKQLGGFDEENLVEDQEIAYRVQLQHGKIRQIEKAFVDTIAPRSFRALRKQRNRWIKGTLLNIIQYRRLLFNKEYGEFGMIVMPVTLISIFLAINALLAFGYYVLWPILNMIQDLWMVGFDIWPYIGSFRLGFSLVDANYLTLLLMWALLSFGVFILYAASRLYEDDMTRYGIFYILPYFFVYFLILSVIAAQVIWEVAIGKKQKW